MPLSPREYAAKVTRRIRGSDSPWVEHITHVTYGCPSQDVSTPDGTWDLVVQKRGGRVYVLQTGLITRPVPLPFAEGDEYWAIAFKPGVFLEPNPGEVMRDKGVMMPVTSGCMFVLDVDRFEIPTFENAEGLVEALRKRSLLRRDPLVERVLEERPKAASLRSVQRHFLRATGVTAKELSQIRRACDAVDLLKRGVSPADVAADLGYSDQPHLTRSLKSLMGQTPRELAGSSSALPAKPTREDR